MKQPNLGYADVKLDFACMHPAGCARRVSLCDYYNLCVPGASKGLYMHLRKKKFFNVIKTLLTLLLHSKTAHLYPSSPKMARLGFFS